MKIVLRQTGGIGGLSFPKKVVEVSKLDAKVAEKIREYVERLRNESAAESTTDGFDACSFVLEILSDDDRFSACQKDVGMTPAFAELVNLVNSLGCQ